jgi:hypothetical protein
VRKNFGKIENWVSLATLAFVALYTGLTYYSLQTAQNQVAISKEAAAARLPLCGPWRAAADRSHCARQFRWHPDKPAFRRQHACLQIAFECDH